MSLQMIHVIGYKMEDGMVCKMFTLHTQRDATLASAEKAWIEMGFQGPAACIHFDVLVPLDPTDEQVNAVVRRYVNTYRAKEVIADVLMDLLVLDAAKDVVTNLIAALKSDDEGPHTVQ